MKTDIKFNLFRDPYQNGIKGRQSEDIVNCLNFLLILEFSYMNMETYSFPLNTYPHSFFNSLFSFSSFLILKQGHMIFLNNSISTI